MLYKSWRESLVLLKSFNTLSWPTNIFHQHMFICFTVVAVQYLNCTYDYWSARKQEKATTTHVHQQQLHFLWVVNKGGRRNTEPKKSPGIDSKKSFLQSPNLYSLKEPRDRFQGIDFASFQKFANLKRWRLRCFQMIGPFKRKTAISIGGRTVRTLSTLGHKKRKVIN